MEHRCLEYHYTKLGRSTGRSTHHQLSTDALGTVTPNFTDLTDIAQYTYMHGRLTPSQSSIDALNTATPHLADLADIAQCTYMHGRVTPPGQSNIHALNTATPNLADLGDIAQCTYMHGRLTPQSIKHRCLEYHYTKLGRSSRYSTMQIYAWQTYPLQSSIDLCKTITPNRFHI